MSLALRKESSWETFSGIEKQSCMMSTWTFINMVIFCKEALSCKYPNGGGHEFYDVILLCKGSFSAGMA